ncbi:TNA1 High-affinity nicotinic acid transporter [Candida maltosa Xu316]|uniref:High-affinity nicotinic acid transporter, putative (Nicotinic acid permease, putative) n=1 Tax=Candida maltosa (strain Xu316) TaxID=1245528 RepID=M3J3L1_CANMX|nr:High-affinity nicotinic acid transporter, putative (Nicotinic acid permease, putative) [Candida maltosa Xu316]
MSSSSVHDEKNIELVKDPEQSSSLESLSEIGESNIDPELKVEQLAEEMGINHRKLMWKIDVWVVPPFCLLYFLSFLDRVNISNANLYGLTADLNLVGNQYNTALAVFFVPYITFEVLANYCIKFVKPHIWLSTLVLLFGGISIGLGFVQNFAGLVACRFFIGVTEASTFPSIFYLLSTYYSKVESQRRFSLFFSCTALSGAASGAIAYKIHDLNMVHGLESWRWIFIIEGAITCGCAFLLFFLIADFPEEARFLTANERQFLKAKLEILSGTQSAFEIKNTLKDVAKCFKDWLIWLSAWCYFFLIIPSYGYAYFAATIINQMGYTAVSAQQHSVYPWVCAFGVINVVAFFSDRFQKRLPFFIGCSTMALIGLALVLGSPDAPKTRYAGCFLTASGLYSAMPLIVCWSSINMSSHIRKSVSTAWQIGFGNIGGIISIFIFLAKDSPRYVPGLSVCVGSVSLAIFTGIAYFYACYRFNNIKQTDAYKQEFNALSEREQILAGDKNPRFVYMY